MSAGELVLVTGASGFIAKHVVLEFLNAGYSVRGSLRSPGRAAEVRQAIAPHLSDPGALGRLSFVQLDLEQENGWPAAMDGVTALIHTASPFHFAVPKNPDELIRPAVDGTLRALRAAKSTGVNRVVLTSSIVSIFSRDVPPDGIFTEAHWSDTNHPNSAPYTRSKTLAERAAWDFVKSEAPDMRLSTICPAYVLGPPLDRHYGASVGLIARFLRGKDPMLPAIRMALSDVRDVALMHRLALETPSAAGLRFLAANGSMWMYEVGQLLKSVYPHRRVPTRKAPKLLVRLLGLFDPDTRSSLAHIDRDFDISNAAAREVLGMQFRSGETAILDCARALVDNGWL